jgi:glycerol-3-phosphate dehydrogenase
VEIFAPLVINATGAWADELRIQAGGQPRLRKLRGSHLLFPRHKFPLTRAISLYHPKDGRPVFAFPWEGVTLLGTTDVDHSADLHTDPAISQAEAEYLLDAVQFAFPALQLSLADVQTTFSGVRAVVNTGKADPSKESREFVLWNENGLLTITGGKLTTFRRMAHRALEAGRPLLPGNPHFDPDLPVLDSPPSEALAETPLDRAARLRLFGRYGADSPQLVAAAKEGELTPIESLTALWAELRWSARCEGVIHLDDLLLRRVRLGLLLPQGAIPWLPRIRSIVQPELGWNDERWEREVEAYTHLWKTSYSLEGGN